ncbi:type II toxin-antitoxin system prevent-host-death family antitoxin [Brevibacterium litoralis]|uniref:type II toxin-antitoxin system prevent-host-death family antitoxin n=1 Tax=Brevibacterium litoralis TaxID=3138935 RepID=UPI0032EF2389
MTATPQTFSGRDFNRNPSAVKRAAQDGPVTVTEHGKPSLVVMTAAEYDRLTPSGPTRRKIGTALLMTEGTDIPLELDDRSIELERDLEL